MSEGSQDSVSRQRVDVKKIKIVQDAKSFTGYSIVALDKEGAGQPGLPASVFEVAMFKEIKRLGEENIKLRNFIDQMRRLAEEHGLFIIEIETLVMGEDVALDVAAEESEDVAA